MTRENFFEILGELDDDIVQTAEAPLKKKADWKLWVAVAACLAIVISIAIGHGRNGYSVTMNNGDTINFVKSSVSYASLDIGVDVTSRELTQDELQALFGDLPVTASVTETADNQILGFTGKIGDAKLVITVPDFILLDSIIVGVEKNTTINDVPVSAGFFVTHPNSKGEKTAIFYAKFELGGQIFYVENAAPYPDREKASRSLIEAVQALIENGELDLGTGQTISVSAADVAPMVYVNDTLYKQSGDQQGYPEYRDEFVYLGKIESQVSSEGAPQENFQANDPIIGCEVYQYGEDLVVYINGSYWLYKKYPDTDAR